MKAWIKATFSDPKGTPSFKRQFASMLGLALIIAVFKNNIGGAEILAVLIAAITTGTVIEKFTKPSNNNEL